MTTVSVRFRVRRRTAASWVSLNEVLLDSEMGLESDTDRFKFGDGVTAWNSLPYASDGRVSSVNGATGVVVLTTADVAEGSNLYFTNARADGRITVQKGAANGLATLGADSKIPSAQLPALALTDVFVVNSQAAQLALTVEEGDVAVRTDLNKSYIQNGGTAGTMADWQELLTPTDTVLSVNGQTGSVVLTTSNIAEGSSLYYTNARADARIAAAVGSTVQAASSVLTFLATASAATAAAVKALLALVKADVGLGNVDNTADTAKPVSTAQQTALNLKANAASPDFTGRTKLSNTISNAFSTVEAGNGATGAFTTITIPVAADNANGALIVEVQISGFSGVYLDYVCGRYGNAAGVVMRSNASGGTTVALSGANVTAQVITITTSVTHPVVKVKATAGGLASSVSIGTITFA